MPQSDNVESELAHLRSWLAPSRRDFRKERPRRELVELLSQHDRFTLNHMTSSVEWIALWEYNYGTYQVLEGDPSGWGHLFLGLECDVWRVRLTLHLHSLKTEADKDYGVTEDTAYAMATAITLRDDSFADWCGQLLAREFANPDFLSDWDLSPVYTYLTWLYAKWRGITIDPRNAPIGSLGVYRNVIANWDNDQAFASALFDACEYHWSRNSSSDESDDVLPEFTSPPYPLFPGEILATLRVREELTGQTVRVYHPFMIWPLGNPPASVPKRVDPLIEQFKERVIAEENARITTKNGN